MAGVDDRKIHGRHALKFGRVAFDLLRVVEAGDIVFQHIPGKEKFIFAAEKGEAARGMELEGDEFKVQVAEEEGRLPGNYAAR